MAFKKTSRARQGIANWARENPTQHEKLLWDRLRDASLGVNVLFQVQKHGYIMDFYCPWAKLNIEVDGPGHKRRVRHDGIRNEILQMSGIETYRVTNKDIEANLDAVVDGIVVKVFQRLPIFHHGRRGRDCMLRVAARYVESVHPGLGTQLLDHFS